MFGSCFAASRRVSVHWMHGCGGWVNPGCSGGQYLHNRNTQAAQWGNGLPRPTNNMKLKKELCKVPRFPAHVKRHREQDQCSCMTCLMDERQKHTAVVLCVRYWCTLCIKIGCGVLMFDYNNVAAYPLPSGPYIGCQLNCRECTLNHGLMFRSLPSDPYIGCQIVCRECTLNT